VGLLDGELVWRCEKVDVHVDVLLLAAQPGHSSDVGDCFYGKLCRGLKSCRFDCINAVNDLLIDIDRIHHDREEQGCHQTKLPLVVDSDEDGDDDGEDSLQDGAHSRPGGSLHLASIGGETSTEGAGVVLLPVVPTDLLGEHRLEGVPSQSLGQILPGDPEHPALEQLSKRGEDAETEEEEGVVDRL